MDDVRILLDLLGIPSPSGEEEAACRVFAEHASRLGFRVTRDAAGNVIASMGEGHPHTMFLGHIDTVPGSWPVGLEDGVVHARGSVDAKGPLVAALLAAAHLGASVPGTRTLVAAVREETDSRGAFEILRQPAPDALLIGEPSGWNRVTVGFRGQRRGRFVATSVPAHASSPVPGALDLAVDAASRLRDHVRLAPARGLFRTPSLRFTGWRHASEMGTETAEFDADLRVPRGFDWEGLERALPEVVWSRPVEAVVVDKGNRVARALVAAVRGQGGVPEFLLKGGTSDMNHAARVWRIPMASYGAGDPNLDHGPEERLSIEEFRASIRVLIDALRSLSRSV